MECWAVISQSFSQVGCNPEKKGQPPPKEDAGHFLFRKWGHKELSTQQTG